VRLTNPKNNPEQVLKRAICEWLSYKAKHCMFWYQPSTGIWDRKKRCYRKLNSPYDKPGKSDILGIWKGRPLAIEVKWGKNVASEDQKKFLKEFEENGGIAILAYSLDDVLTKLTT